MKVMVSKRSGATAVLLALMVGCGGIVDIVNEQGDPRDASTDGGSSDGANDASTTADGGTIAWGAESGSRLSAVWWKTDDGARQFAGWHDDLLGQDCSFMHMTDSVDRCIPGPNVQVYGTPNIFEDAECKVPLVGVAKQPEVPSCALTAPVPGDTYATLVYSAPTGGGSCGFAFELHALKKVTALAHVYDGEGCTQTDADSAIDYFEYGDVVSPTTFVGSKVAPEPASTRLTFLTRTSDDGARERLYAYDQVLGVTCGAEKSADGTMRCLPDTTGEVDVFSDSNCGAPLEYCDQSTSCDHDTCGNPVPFASAPEQVGGCDVRFHVYPVTGIVPEGTQVFHQTATSCDPFYVVSNQPTAHVGAEIDPSMFVPLVSTFLASATRLKRYAWDPGSEGSIGVATQRYIGGHGYTDLGWRDGARVEDCALGATTENLLRCLPQAAGAQAFSDPNCSAGLVQAGTTAGCSGIARYISVASDVLDPCTRVRLFEIGSELGDASTFRLTLENDGGVSCPSFTPPPDTTYVAGGADVTARFASFSRVIE